MEQLAAAAAFHHVVAVELPCLKTVTFLYQSGCAGKLLRRHLRHLDLVFHVVVVLDEAQTFKVLGIIGIVVVDIHRRNLVEALDEHALAVHVLEAHRSHQFGESLPASPVGHGLQKCVGHLGIVGEVEPAETHYLALPVVVGPAVDDARDAAAEPAVLVGHEILGVAKSKRGVLVPGECLQLVAVEIGNCIRGIAVKVVVELHKRLQLLTGGYRLYFNAHTYSI